MPGGSFGWHMVPQMLRRMRNIPEQHQQQLQQTVHQIGRLRRKNAMLLQQNQVLHQAESSAQQKLAMLKEQSAPRELCSMPYGLTHE